MRSIAPLSLIPPNLDHEYLVLRAVLFASAWLGANVAVRICNWTVGGGYAITALPMSVLFESPFDSRSNTAGAWHGGCIFIHILFDRPIGWMADKLQNAPRLPKQVEAGC